jgi:hypothetical protein
MLVLLVKSEYDDADLNVELGERQIKVFTVLNNDLIHHAPIWAQWLGMQQRPQVSKNYVTFLLRVSLKQCNKLKQLNLSQLHQRISIIYLKSLDYLTGLIVLALKICFWGVKEDESGAGGLLQREKVLAKHLPEKMRVPIIIQ